MNLVGVHAGNALGGLPAREDGVGDGENPGRRRSCEAPGRGIGERIVVAVTIVVAVIVVVGVRL